MNQTSLEKILSYALFRHLEFSILDSAYQKIGEAEIIEYDDRYISLKWRGNERKISLVQDRIQYLSTRYKGGVFSFNVENISLENKNNFTYIKAKVVSEGEYLNRRLRTRNFFERETSVDVHLISKHGLNKIALSSCELLDFNQSQITFEYNRSLNCLLVPGEHELSLKLSSLDKVIACVRGKVQFVRFNGDKHIVIVTNLKADYENIISVSDSTRLVRNENSQRLSERFELPDSVNCFFSTSHPYLLEKSLRFQVKEISNGGMSFNISDSFAIHPGMILSGVLVLPNQEDFKLSFLVIGVKRDSGFLRVGGTFIDLDVKQLKNITNFLSNHALENVVDAKFRDFDDIWEFFFETGFIYESKRKQLQIYSNAILDTYKKLLKNGSNVLKKILYKKNGEIKGHVSAVKFFDSAWVVQHLNALKVEGPSAAANVLSAITKFYIDPNSNLKSNTRYLCAYFRPNNLYSNTLFKGIEKHIGDKEICSSNLFTFSSLKKDLHIEEALDISSVREATKSDLYKLERVLIESGRHKELVFRDLSAERITNLVISEEYKKIGLYRSRKVFYIEKDSDDFIFAICDYCSPGVNLSELTNSFQLVYSSPNFHRASELSILITKKVVESYQKTDMKHPVLLSNEGDIIPDQYETKKSYVFWFLDTNYSNLFREATDVIFKNFKKMLREKAKIENHEKKVG